MESDELLIKKTLEGNQDAFRKIVESYQTFVLAVCFNIIRDKHEAENLAQETFLQVYLSLVNYENKGFKTWIGRIATNKSIDWKRKNQAKNANTVVYLDDISIPTLETGENVEERIFRKENEKRIIFICSQLPDKYSSVLRKYYLQEKTYRQIAEEEQISVKTVESRLYRAKQVVRKKWKEENYEAL